MLIDKRLSSSTVAMIGLIGEESEADGMDALINSLYQHG
jgi:hypothetical protein